MSKLVTLIKGRQTPNTKCYKVCKSFLPSYAVPVEAVRPESIEKNTVGLPFAIKMST